MVIRSYRELEVWQKAMDLVVLCYQVAEKFPKGEMYGLLVQLQRAVVSVPANIAEGQGRNHTREFINHLSIAYGSPMEVETNEIGRMLNGLKQSLNRKLNTDH